MSRPVWSFRCTVTVVVTPWKSSTSSAGVFSSSSGSLPAPKLPGGVRTAGSTVKPVSPMTPSSKARLVAARRRAFASSVAASSISRPMALISAPARARCWLSANSEKTRMATTTRRVWPIAGAVWSGPATSESAVPPRRPPPLSARIATALHVSENPSTCTAAARHRCVTKRGVDGESPPRRGSVSEEDASQYESAPGVRSTDLPLVYRRRGHPRGPPGSARSPRRGRDDVEVGADGAFEAAFERVGDEGLADGDLEDAGYGAEERAEVGEVEVVAGVEAEAGVGGGAGGGGVAVEHGRGLAGGEGRGVGSGVELDAVGPHGGGARHELGAGVHEQAHAAALRPQRLDDGAEPVGLGGAERPAVVGGPLAGGVGD